MALTHSEPLAADRVAPDFNLLGTDGRHYTLADFAGAKALVVVFMCNHCPYVIAVQGRINALAKEYAARGVKLVGINSNDSVRYPDDNFEAMQRRAREEGFAFPYLWDETQAVARAYGAVCTPDFFLYAPAGASASAAKWIERYRGRLDDNWKDEHAVKRRDLAGALDAILAGKPGPLEQPSSMGCSIKWKVS